MQIDATVLRIIFPREGAAPTGFWVVHTTAGRMAGATLATLGIGKKYSFEGSFEIYHGQQNFRFKSCRENIPTNPRDILDYACQITHGLGPAYAESIWSKYHEDFYHALEDGYERSNLTNREADLLDTLRELKRDAKRADAVSWLISKNATERIAEQAYEHFKDELKTVVSSNPYALTALNGQSWKTVDIRFREPFCIAMDDPLRIRSFLDYRINSIADTAGSTLVNLEVDEAALLCGVECKDIEGAIASGDYIRTPDGLITSRMLYHVEKQIFDYFQKKHDVRKPKKIELPSDITLNESQISAVEAACYNGGVTIINGGAGCGKTTIIKTIAETLRKRGADNVRLCSFAGKAAARIREATGFEAGTIHSMLEYNPTIGFLAGSLSHDTVIIDEASMVPAYLLAEVCKRNPERLILVGDEAQLPPVGAGAPFHDFVHMGIAHTVTTCYRNSEAIFSAAYAVRNGERPEPAKSKSERFNIIGVRGPEGAHAYIQSILRNMDFDDDIIITPQNGEEREVPASVTSLNTLVMSHLNVTSKKQIGTRIICLKNDPRVGVWNGTTAVVDAVDIDKYVWVTTDENKQKRINPDYFREHTAPAYALTIHKAQGSQYRRVVIIALRRDFEKLLDRQMFYTAVTRAKESCLVITDMDLTAVAQKLTSRRTILAALIAGELQ